MSALGFELLFRILWGFLFALFWVSRIEASERFIRIALRIALGFFVACAALAATAPFDRASAYASLILCLAGFTSYVLGTGAAARGLGFLSVTFAPLPFLLGRGWAGSFNFVSSGLFLGFTFGSQYLGHWFLNVPGLHIRELQRLIRGIIFGLALKCGEILVTLLLHTGTTPAVDAMGRPLENIVPETAALPAWGGPAAMLGLQGNGMFGLSFFGVLLLLTRLLWGILAPIVLTMMIKRTVDSRSTQSATGILYAMSVMLLLGEAVALYFRMTLGWNL